MRWRGTERRARSAAKEASGAPPDPWASASIPGPGLTLLDCGPSLLHAKLNAGQPALAELCAFSRYGTCPWGVPSVAQIDALLKREAVLQVQVWGWWSENKGSPAGPKEPPQSQSTAGMAAQTFHITAHFLFCLLDSLQDGSSPA